MPPCKTGADADAVGSRSWYGSGELLTDARARLVDALQPYWAAALRDLDALPVSLGYFQGWSREPGPGGAR